MTTRTRKPQLAPSERSFSHDDYALLRKCCTGQWEHCSNVINEEIENLIGLLALVRISDDVLQTKTDFHLKPVADRFAFLQSELTKYNESRTGVAS